MSGNKLPLWRIAIYVKPTPEHPQFFSMQWGIFHVWLTDKSGHRAGERALAVAQQLPFEIDQRPPTIIAVCSSTSDQSESSLENTPLWSITKRLEAQEHGFDCYIEMWTVGADEPPGVSFGAVA